MAGMVRKYFLSLFIFIFSIISINALEFTGNIQDPLDLTSNINLNELLNSTSPKADYVLLIGSDGTAALITSRSFHNIELVKLDSTWNSESYNLPAVCNIRNLKEICIYTKSFDLNRFSERLNDFEFIGQSSKNGHFVRKYKE